MAQPRTRMTRDNTAVLLIDYQVGLLTGVRDIGVAELKHNVVGLAKAVRVLQVTLRAGAPVAVPRPYPLPTNAYAEAGQKFSSRDSAGPPISTVRRFPEADRPGSVLPSAL
jgi:nicotinamidase-related amidase